jgi:hypothetical protein
MHTFSHNRSNCTMAKNILDYKPAIGNFSYVEAIFFCILR